MRCCAGSLYVVQIQPRKHVPDHADYTAPTRQHELNHTDYIDHTDHIDHTDQESICPAWQIQIMNYSGVRSYRSYRSSALKYLDHGVGIGYLCPRCEAFRSGRRSSTIATEELPNHCICARESNHCFGFPLVVF